MIFKVEVFRKLTLILFFLFSLSDAFSQKKFDLHFQEKRETINGKSIIGYSTTFDFLRSEVRRGWWKFSKKFGSPLDMRTYYELKIPAELNDGNIDLIIYSVSTEDGYDTQFFLGVASSNFRDQVASILHDFKKSFYLDYYLDELKSKENHASYLSNRYDKEIENREEVLNLIFENQREINNTKNEILQIEVN